MNGDFKQRMLLFAALFLTIVFIMNGVFPSAPKKVTPDPAASEDISPSTDTGNTAIAANSKGDEPFATAEAAKEVISNIVVTAGNFEATFTSIGASLKRYRLMNHWSDTSGDIGTELVVLDEINAKARSLVIDKIGGNNQSLSQLNYQLVSAPNSAVISGDAEVSRNTDDVLIFSAVVDGWAITKTYTFDGDLPHCFSMDIEAKNLSANTRKFSCELIGASGIVPDDKGGRWSQVEGVAGAVEGENSDEAEAERVSLAQLTVAEPNYDDKRGYITWAGLSNRFFSALLITDDANLTRNATWKRVEPSDDYLDADDGVDKSYFFDSDGARLINGRSSIITNKFSVASGDTHAMSFSFYGGPTDDDSFAFDPRLEPAVSYTIDMFASISRLLLRLLNWIAVNVTGNNYGIALIIVTLIVKLLLHPLTRKSLISGQKMQKLQPLMKELKAKYKNDQAKMHQETMKVWREQGVSPMGGCLPMLVQMPIFFALYGTFARGFAFRQASFLWIDDLSQADRLYELASSVFFIGHDINLLPVIYLVLQVIQMSMQPKSQDPAVQQQQKMMKIMPLVFVFIFYSMPSGLVLYFTISSAFTLFEHWLIKRRLKAEDEEAGSFPPAGASAGTGMGGKK